MILSILIKLNHKLFLCVSFSKFYFLIYISISCSIRGVMTSVSLAVATGRPMMFDLPPLHLNFLPPDGAPSWPPSRTRPGYVESHHEWWRVNQLTDFKDWFGNVTSRRHVPLKTLVASPGGIHDT